MVVTDELITVEDYRNEAPKHLPKDVLDYYESGADEQRTLKRNEEAYKRLLIRPHCLRDVSNVDTSVEWFGKRHPFPIGVAPTAFHKLADPKGEVATVTGASGSHTVMICSSFATTPMEKVAKNRGNATIWFQALVLTIDSPVGGTRLSDIRNVFTLPKNITLANFNTEKVEQPEFDSLVTWNALEWLVSFTKLPVIVKGVLRGDDAIMTLEKGAKGIIVSNHGGRQMDSAPATIEALPEVIRAVNDRIPVFIDGGIRNGRDVFKAIALGAAGVFVGRPILRGLAVNGSSGVEDILKILQEEFIQAMKLSGCRTIAQLQQSKDVVVHENIYSKI